MLPLIKICSVFGFQRFPSPHQLWLNRYRPQISSYMDMQKGRRFKCQVPGCKAAYKEAKNLRAHETMKHGRKPKFHRRAITTPWLTNNPATTASDEPMVSDIGMPPIYNQAASSLVDTDPVASENLTEEQPDTGGSPFHECLEGQAIGENCEQDALSQLEDFTSNHSLLTPEAEQSLDTGLENGGKETMSETGESNLEN